MSQGLPYVFMFNYPFPIPKQIISYDAPKTPEL